MNNIVVAIVGLAGTGKSELSHVITSEYGFTPVYFGGCILQEVRRRGLEVNSENERSIREDLRSKRGMQVIAELSYPSIQAALETGSSVVIDGLYSYSEYEYLRAKIPKFFLLALHSSKQLRYERLVNRNHRSLSPSEVDERDYFELKNLEKCHPIVLADYHIVNDDSVNKLVVRLSKIMSQIVRI